MRKSLDSKKHIVAINDNDQNNFIFPSPKKLIEELINLKKEEISKFIQEKIFINLKTAPMQWIQEFIQDDGLTILTGILAKTNLLSGM